MSSRVLTVTDPDGNALSYSYDACGERASMALTVNGTIVTDVDYRLLITERQKYWDNILTASIAAVWWS